jgi:hypothetical protein
LDDGEVGTLLLLVGVAPVGRAIIVGADGAPLGDGGEDPLEVGNVGPMGAGDSISPLDDGAEGFPFGDGEEGGVLTTLDVGGVLTTLDVGGVGGSLAPLDEGTVFLLSMGGIVGAPIIVGADGAPLGDGVSNIVGVAKGATVALLIPIGGPTLSLAVGTKGVGTLCGAVTDGVTTPGVGEGNDGVVGMEGDGALGVDGTVGKGTMGDAGDVGGVTTIGTGAGGGSIVGAGTG